MTSDLGGLRHEGLVGSPFVIDWVHADKRITANYEGTVAEAFARIADAVTSQSATRTSSATA